VTQCYQNFFPNAQYPGASNYTFQQVVDYYDLDPQNINPQQENYTLREPRKTFRLTISTSF
jgi:hypothetical protein